MVARFPLDISEGFYEDFSPQFADLKCLNLYPFVAEAPAYSQTGLRATEGLRLKVDTDRGAGRGSLKVGTTPYFVQGSTLLSIDFAGTVTEYGTIAGSGEVSIAQNGSIIWIVVPGAQSYYFVISTGVLTLNVDPNFLGPATSVSFIGSYFVFTRDDFFFTSNLDGITFTPTDQGVAETDPDKIVASVINHNQLYIFGTSTIQVFKRGQTGFGFPFLNIEGASVEKGLSARFSVVKADNTFFWLGGSENEEAAMYRFVGNQAGKISTPAIDNYIQGLSGDDVSACVAQAWMTGGEEFVSFSFPSRTFVYLISATNKKGRHMWMEKETNGSKHRATNALEAFNEILFLDTLSGNIGVLDKDVYTEYGTVKTRMFTTQPFHQGGNPYYGKSYEMKMETGVGNNASEAPVLNHSFSDNGINFHPVLSRFIGGKGEYSTRLVWRRMGRIPVSRVLKFEVTEPCNIVFYRVEAELNG